MYGVPFATGSLPSVVYFTDVTPCGSLVEIDAWTGASVNQWSQGPSALSPTKHFAVMVGPLLSNWTDTGSESATLPARSAASARMR